MNKEVNRAATDEAAANVPSDQMQFLAGGYKVEDSAGSLLAYLYVEELMALVVIAGVHQQVVIGQEEHWAAKGDNWAAVFPGASNVTRVFKYDASMFGDFDEFVTEAKRALSPAPTTFMRCRAIRTPLP